MKNRKDLEAQQPDFPKLEQIRRDPVFAPYVGIVEASAREAEYGLRYLGKTRAQTKRRRTSAVGFPK